MAKSILIIDDDRDLRFALKLVFECNDYKVYEAGNGNEGIAAFHKNPIDIILTDIFMPQKDGLETIKHIKKEFPQVIIIAMSGVNGGSGDFLKVAGYLGAAECIRKPFYPDDIVRLVNLALERNEKSL